jgi:hypothetical protein
VLGEELSAMVQRLVVSKWVYAVLDASILL